MYTCNQIYSSLLIFRNPTSTLPYNSPSILSFTIQVSRYRGIIPQFITQQGRVCSEDRIIVPLPLNHSLSFPFSSFRTASLLSASPQYRNSKVVINQLPPRPVHYTLQRHKTRPFASPLHTHAALGPDRAPFPGSIPGFGQKDTVPWWDTVVRRERKGLAPLG
jgi:hypothetical protein